ncbi:MAG: hypothetical protein AAF743_11540 [Planctomycetota bacterium]
MIAHESSRRMVWKLGTAACFVLAVGLVALSVWLAVEALSRATAVDMWSTRLLALSALAVAHLLLAWGVTSKVYPVSAVDKSIALASMLTGTLAGVGALALALA